MKSLRRNAPQKRPVELCGGSFDKSDTGATYAKVLIRISPSDRCRLLTLAEAQTLAPLMSAWDAKRLLEVLPEMLRGKQCG